MSKFARFGDYPSHSLPSVQSALLTLWPSLARYHDELALVGGMAVHYLTKSGGYLPGAVTMDVDLGISLAASGEQYGTISSDLSGLGFRQEGQRLVKAFEGLNLYLDFLTEDPTAATGTRRVDDIVASVLPGINRALQRRRFVTVSGCDLFGAEKRVAIAVSDIGPLLVLKLNAFGGPTGRRHPKDAYDILLAVTQFIDGPRAAVAAFHAEANAGNTAYAHAIETLRKDFSDRNHDGPVRAANFSIGEDQELRNRIREDLVTVGRLLLGS